MHRFTLLQYDSITSNISNNNFFNKQIEKITIKNKVNNKLITNGNNENIKLLEKLTNKINNQTSK